METISGEPERLGARVTVGAILAMHTAYVLSAEELEQVRRPAFEIRSPSPSTR
jgi:hypothetical protein